MEKLREVNMHWNKNILTYVLFLFLCRCFVGSLLCLGVSWSELQERPRTLPGAGQSSSGGTTFDLLQSCGPGEWVILPQCAKDHRFGTRGTQDLNFTILNSKRDDKRKTQMRDDSTKTLVETCCLKSTRTPRPPPWDRETHLKRTLTPSAVSCEKHYFVFPSLRARLWF